VDWQIESANLPQVMTQSVTFRFTSPHFNLESGIIAFTKGARLFSGGEFRVGEIRDGLVDDVLVEGPIEFDAAIGNLSVVRHDNRRRYHVEFLNVTGKLRSEDLRSGQVQVRLNLPVILIIRVEDSGGTPVSNVGVSLHLPDSEATSEVRTNDAGEIVLLGSVGKYSASVGLVQNRRLRPSVSADLDIMPEDSGERIVVLRVPPASGPQSS
jgi:hypothetical protein